MSDLNDSVLKGSTSMFTGLSPGSIIEDDPLFDSLLDELYDSDSD